METCRVMVGRNWRKMLSVFRELLLRCNSEAMILLLLKVGRQHHPVAAVGLAVAAAGPLAHGQRLSAAALRTLHTVFPVCVSVARVIEMP